MAASKREQLLEYLKNTLLPTITTANGYNFDLTNIYRGFRALREFDDSKFPVVVMPGPHERRSNITHAGFKAVIEVSFVGYVKNSSADPNAAATGALLDLDHLIQDLTKALSADLEQGGRVHTTTIRDITTDDGDNIPTAGMVMTVEFMLTATGANP